MKWRLILEDSGRDALAVCQVLQRIVPDCRTTFADMPGCLPLFVLETRNQAVAERHARDFRNAGGKARVDYVGQKG